MSTPSPSILDDISGAITDGWCLRESTANDIYGTLIDGLPAPNHTALPSSMLVLLAKGLASTGNMTWESPLDLLGYNEGDAWNSGPEVYSIVVAGLRQGRPVLGLSASRTQPMSAT